MSNHVLRLKSRRLVAEVEAPTAGEQRAVDFAWRVHAAQATWANHADVKASILLVLEGGALYAAVSALAVGGFLSKVGSRVGSVVVAAGIEALLLAIAAAAIAIFPRLGRNRRSSGPQTIYFGDLRHWQAAELSGHLARMTENYELEILSWQLTKMSRRNWVKHRWVQISLVLSLSGIIIIAIAALVSAGG